MALEAHPKGRPRSEQEPILQAVFKESKNTPLVQLVRHIHKKEGASLWTGKTEDLRRPIAGFLVGKTRCIDPGLTVSQGGQSGQLCRSR